MDHTETWLQACREVQIPRKLAQMEAAACLPDGSSRCCHAWLLCMALQACMCACREAQIKQRIARQEATKPRNQSPELLKLPGGGDIMGRDDLFSSAMPGARHH